MAAEIRKCSTCGSGFLGTKRALYCSAACKQQAHRRRSGRYRNAPTVTVTASGAHTDEALAILAGLDEELASNAKVLGRALVWSAAERAVREMVASEIDRRVWLSEAYSQAGEDVALRVKLATELRLTEQAVARMLRQVKTDMPLPVSRKSQKARHAANTRWDRENA